MTPRARHRLLCAVGAALWLSWCAFLVVGFAVLS